MVIQSTNATRTACITVKEFWPRPATIASSISTSTRTHPTLPYSEVLSLELNRKRSSRLLIIGYKYSFIFSFDHQSKTIAKFTHTSSFPVSGTARLFCGAGRIKAVSRVYAA